MNGHMKFGALIELRLILLEAFGTTAIQSDLLNDHANCTAPVDRIGDMPAVHRYAAGVDDAVVIGLAGGSPTAALLAATHPDRVRLLVLYAVWARGNPADAATITAWGGGHGEDLNATIGEIRNRWGHGYTAHRSAPSLTHDAEFVQWCGDYERSIATVDHAVALARLDHDWDITAALPTIQAPTLVLQRVNDEVCVAPHARFVAGHIEGVTYVEMPGLDHWPWAVDGDRLVNEITAFVAATPPERVGFDRILTTVVVTDVVDASPLTKGAAGRRPWYEHLDDHHALLRRTLDAFRGEPLAATGDGYVARFASAARAVRWADELRRQIIPLGIELRTGVHTGELERGPDESEAVTVRIAHALGNLAQPNEIIVSRTVTDLVRGAGIEFAPRGERELPGAPGIWPILAVTDC